MKKHLRLWAALICLLCLILTLGGCKKKEDPNANKGANGEFKFTKPVTVIVPFTAGGPTDQMVRVLQPYLEKQLGVNVIIENPAGAGGAIGTMEFLSKAPDGYTIMFGAPTNVVFRPLTSGTDYSYEKDFQAVSMVASTPITVAVKENGPYKDAKTLLEAIKAHPDNFSYANAGNGSITDVAFQKLLLKANLKVKAVPFSGTADGYTAVMGDHVNALVCNLTEATGKEGIHSILNLGSPANTKEGKEIPTCDQLGFKDCVTDTFFGFYYTNEVPANAVETFDKAVGTALQDPECVKKYAAIKQTVTYKNAKDFDAYLRSFIKSTTESLQALDLLVK